MREFFGSIVPAGLAMSLSAGQPGAPSPGVRALAQGNTAFALDLYAKVKDQPGNCFLSPYSISACLAMASAGARGETEAQMVRALHLPPPADAHAAFGELQRLLNEAQTEPGSTIRLSVANALWAQQGHPFLPAFLDLTRKGYEANVNQVDFATGAEPARLDINRWVAGKTEDKIRDLLPPGSVGSLTRLVLANAIYFKGAWYHPFHENQTTVQPFHTTVTQSTDVHLMHQVEESNYGEGKDFQALELSYRGGRLSMVILLPRQIDGCAALEGQLTPAWLAGTLGAMQRQRVDLSLPKFTLDCRLKLNPILASLGMTDAFDKRSDFSGMDGTRELVISGVFHQAWVEVNEAGTEAAAATAAVMALRAVRPAGPPRVFRADHPFVFLIRDTRSGSVLFLGRLAQPVK